LVIGVTAPLPRQAGAASRARVGPWHRPRASAQHHQAATSCCACSARRAQPWRRPRATGVQCATWPATGVTSGSNKRS